MLKTKYSCLDFNENTLLTPSDDHHNFLAAHPPEVSSTEMSLTMYFVKVYLKSLYYIQYTLYIETVKLRLLLT